MDTLKSILLHADASPHTLQRLHFAGRLAQRHGASVTALYATLPVAIQYASPFALGVEIAPLMLEYESERLARARAQFEPVAATMTPRPAWLESSGEPVYCVAQQALCSDLVILSQRDPGSDAASDLPVDFVESVVIASGRPVMNCVRDSPHNFSIGMSRLFFSSRLAMFVRQDAAGTSRGGRSPSLALRS